MDESSVELDKPVAYTFEKTGSQRLEISHTGKDKKEITLLLHSISFRSTYSILVKRSEVFYFLNKHNLSSIPFHCKIWYENLPITAL